MGMFDTVIVEKLKLKVPNEVESFLKKNNSSLPKEFQTKDLDNCLNTFTIDKNGQIWGKHHVLTGKRKVYSDPFTGWKDNRSFLEKLYFNLKYKNDKTSRYIAETKPVNKREYFTKNFNIYTIEEFGGRYLELDVKITANNGKVKKAELENYSIESESKSKERKKNDSEFQKRMNESFELRRKFVSRWYYPVLKEIYNPFVFFTRQSLLFLIGKLNIALVRWRGV